MVILAFHIFWEAPPKNKTVLRIRTVQDHENPPLERSPELVSKVASVSGIITIDSVLFLSSKLNSSVQTMFEYSTSQKNNLLNHLLLGGKLSKML